MDTFRSVSVSRTRRRFSVGLAWIRRSPRASSLLGRLIRALPLVLRSSRTHGVRSGPVLAAPSAELAPARIYSAWTAGSRLIGGQCRAMSKLLPGENLVLKDHPHWITVVGSLILPAVLVIGGVIADFTILSPNNVNSIYLPHLRTCLTLRIAALALPWLIVV